MRTYLGALALLRRLGRGRLVFVSLVFAPQEGKRAAGFISVIGPPVLFDICIYA